MKEFNGLTKSEIKKVNKAGGGKIGEYYSKKSTFAGKPTDDFYDVICTIFDDEYENIIATVELVVCMFDRRKSFIAYVR